MAKLKKKPAPRRAPVPPPVSGRPWLLVPFGGLALGVVVALLLAWWADSTAPTTAQEQAQAAEGVLAPSAGVPRPAAIDSYRVTYRVSEPGSPVQVDRRQVKRPFDGRAETYSAGGRLVSGLITSERGSFIYLGGAKPGGGKWETIQTGSFRAAGDAQLAATLDWEVAHHQARLLGRTRILGRSCTYVRTGAPVGSPTQAPTRRTYVDLCVDARTGLALDETWIIDGKLVRDRRAVHLEVDPSIGPDTFEVASAGPVAPLGAPGSAVVTALTPPEIGQLRIWMPTPRGFHPEGVEVQTTFQAPTSATQSATASGATVVYSHYVEGPVLVDLEQGVTPPAPAGAVRVPIGHGRYGQLTTDLTASYLDLELGGGLSARLEGPDPALLIRLAGTVRVRSAAP